MRAFRGSALIEVLVAFALLAVTLAAALRASSVAADGTLGSKGPLLETRVAQSGISEYAERADTVARTATRRAAAIVAEDDVSVDHLNERWARELPAMLAEGAALTGVIADEQAKFNLNNLVRGTAPSPADVLVLQRLLGALGLPDGLAEAIVDWLDPDESVTDRPVEEDLNRRTAGAAYRAPIRQIADVGELAGVKGMTPEALARLVPHVTALPDETPVNVNTASATVLLALVPSLSAADLAAIIDARSRSPFRAPEEFVRALPMPADARIEGAIDVKSRFFSASTTIRVGPTAAGYRALIERGERGRTVIIALTQIHP